MGRETRRVALNWKHPKAIGEAGFQPLYDKTAQEAWKEWLKEFKEYVSNNKPDEPYREFCEWGGMPPDPAYYRPKFKGKLGFQRYENTSEGTPVSPVFETEEELTNWLYRSGEYKEWTWQEQKLKANNGH